MLGAVILLAGIALPPQDAALPTRRTIQAIERRLAFVELIGDVGTFTGMKAPPVRVRAVICLAEPGGARCDYELDTCTSFVDADGDGWCSVTRHFVRAETGDFPDTGARGWRAVPEAE